MNEKEIFDNFIKPFLQKYNFKQIKKRQNVYTFQNTINTNLYIYTEHDVKKKAISIQLQRHENTIIPYYELLLFLDDPQFPDTTILDGFWYYDSSEELIGVLEEQANLLEQKGFTWLNGTSSIDLGKIVNEYAWQREQRYNSASEEERQRNFQEALNYNSKWKQRRIMLKKWKNIDGFDFTTK